jgi:alpha-tubulin suppressor-like RCC1 family protein
MLNAQNLINKICDRINCGGLTDLQACQTTGALDILCAPVCGVPSFANLPDPITYAGRMIYVTDERRYYHAVEDRWFNNFESYCFVYATQVWSWGCNQNGELGNNSTTNRSSPVCVVGGFTDWCSVSAGYMQIVTIKSNGTAWSWGSNTYGLVGDGTVVNRSSPVSVVGGITNWCQVTAGGMGGFTPHSMGVTSSGVAWAWGGGTFGKLGNNAGNTNSCSPISVVGNLCWCQLSAGGSHSLGVTSSGSAWAWGRNYGRLGDLTTTIRSSPVSVVGEFTDWCQVSASDSHSMGLRTVGSLWSWGANGEGRLGDNTTANRSSPVSVVGGFTDWCQARAGSNMSLGLRSSGSLWAWGGGSQGQLGNNGSTSVSSPVSVVGGFANWCGLAAGNNFSLGITTAGQLWSWGLNTAGSLGDNTTTNRSSPVSVVGGITSWCQISAGKLSAGIGQIFKGC